MSPALEGKAKLVEMVGWAIAAPALRQANADNSKRLQGCGLASGLFVAFIVSLVVSLGVFSRSGLTTTSREHTGNNSLRMTFEYLQGIS